MTSQEIRTKGLQIATPLGVETAKLEIMQEIAAQLAELNEQLYDLNMLRVQVEPGQFPINIQK